MRLRDSVALTLPSFLLRVVLSVTFLWAGCGKLMGTLQVSGDDAARLANLGVSLTPVAPEAPTDPTPAAPPQALPDSEQAQQDTGSAQDTSAADAATDAPAQGDAEPVDSPAKDPIKLEGANDTSDDVSMRPRAAQITLVQSSSGAQLVGSDFPDLVETKRVYSIALLISKCADPGLTPDSVPITPVMPTALAQGPWPTLLAWSAAITELGAGLLLLLGLLTRFSAMGTFVVMLVAMWMTQLGPAALHTPDAILGFIPRHDDVFSPAAYGTLLWQLALASMSLAVVFLGSGPIGIDRLIFGANPRDPYVHGDPKGGKPAPTPQPSRSEFDRSPNPTP